MPKWTVRRRAFCRTLTAAAAILLGSWLPALAMEDRDPASVTVRADAWDINDDGIFTVAVFGDSLADGYWGGLYRELARDERFSFLRYARNSTGLSRPDYYDWPTAIDEFLTSEPIDAVVISMGANDGQAMYVAPGQWIQLGADEWVPTYRERVEATMRRLVAAGVHTYWMGLPAVRGRHMVATAQRLNPIYEDCAREIGVTFVPLWDLTADANGDFTSYLPDQDGRSRLMRHNDGVHFTSRGYSMIADLILEVMGQELALFDDQGEDVTQ